MHGRIHHHIWSRITKKPAEDTISCRFAMYLVWFGASGYAYLRQQEGLNVDFTDWQLLIIIPGITLVGWFVSSILCGRRPTVDDVRLSFAGALSAYGVVEVAVSVLHGSVASWEIQIAIAFALLATRLVPICPSDRYETIISEIMVGMSAFGMILTYLRIPSITQSPIVELAIAVLPTLTLMFVADIHRLLRKACLPTYQNEHMRDIVYFKTPCLLFFMMWLGLALPPVSNLSEGREAFLCTILTFGILIGMDLFDMFAKFPEEVKDTKNIAITKNVAYNRIMLMVIGLLITSILYVGQVNLDFSHISTWAISMIFPFFGVCLVMRAIPGRKLQRTDETESIEPIERIQPRGAVLLFFLSLAYILLFVLIYWLREPVYTSWLDLLLVFPIVGSILFISNGMLQNDRLLCGISMSDAKKDWALRIAIIEIIIGCFVVFPFAVLPSRQSDSISFSTLSPLLGILGLYMASCVLPRLAIRGVGCPPEGFMIKNAGFAGVKQDTWNSFIMIAATGLLIIHLVEWQILNRSWLSILLTILAFLGVTTTLVRYTLENNSKHYRETYVDGVFKDAKNEGIDAINEQHALKKHLENQAHLVFVTLFPYFLFLLLWDLRIRRPENPEMKKNPFVVTVYNHYLLRLPGLHKYAENEEYMTCFDSRLLPLSYQDKKGNM